MGNREKRFEISRIVRSIMITVGLLTVLIAIVAWLLSKRIISERWLMPAMLSSCLIAGAAGTVLFPVGEGNRGYRIIAAAVPALCLVMLGGALYFSDGLGSHVPLSSLCLFLPGLIAALTGLKKRKKHSAPKRNSKSRAFRG